MDPGECGVREECGVLVGAGCWQAERGFARAARREKGLGLAGCLGHGFGCWAAVPRGLGFGFCLFYFYSSLSISNSNKI